jgi:leucyl aminopeptidase
MTIQFSLTDQAPETATTACIVVGVFEDRMLTVAAARVDEKSGGAIKRLIEAGDINGKLCSSQLLFALPGITAPRVLVVGLGEQKKFDAGRFQRACGEAARALKGLPLDSAVSYLTEVEVPGKDAAWSVRTAALATDAQAYKYTATFKPRDKSKTPEFSALAFAAPATSASVLPTANAIAAGVRYARELGNLPPNICTPAYIAAQAEKFAHEHPGVSCEILEEEDMGKLGMGALLGVAQGSANEPKLIVLQWRGAGENDKPYALVGKGITFDTGGISIKPSAGMEEMKFDMCGGASVLGAFVSAVELKLKLNLVCIVPAVENMPGGKAQRPSDVVTTMSGQTVEVLNTDAEGRLILCDALTYVQKFKPQVIIDTRRRSCRRTPRRRRDDARPRLAPAAVGRLPEPARHRLCRYRQHRRQVRRRDNGRLLPVALHRRLPLGAPRHRRHGLGRRPQGFGDRKTGVVAGAVSAR